MLQGVLVDDGLGTSSYIVGTRTPLLVLSREHGYNPYTGGCQNYGPFLDPYYNTATNI